MKIKSVITLPYARTGKNILSNSIVTQSKNKNASNLVNILRRSEHIEDESHNVVIERVKGPNYHQHVENMRRMEECRKRRIEAQRSNRRQISEWAQF